MRWSPDGTLIIGAGFAGLSTALHLADFGEPVIVLDQDPVGSHASGNNAGMIRQTLADPVTAQFAIEGSRALKVLSRSHRDIGFQPNGSLLLSRGPANADLDAIVSVLKPRGIELHKLSTRQAQKLAPPVAGAAFERALFCPSDALVDIGGLLKALLSQLQRKKVQILPGLKIRSIRRVGGKFHIQAGTRTFLVTRIVNASGAWAGAVARFAKASRIPFFAYRRHLFESEPCRAQKNLPFVWDLSSHFYFRPLKHALLLSPCDKDLFKLSLGKKPARAESADAKVRKIFFKKLAAYPALSGLKIAKEKASLRTMTPDGRFVIGEDIALPGFFWAAGLGGHGVTTCLSVGKLTADLIYKKNVDPQIKRAVSPERFFIR